MDFYPLFYLSRGFKAPPEGVKSVVSCLVVFLDGVQDDYWQAARRIFSDASVFSRIKEFDPRNIKRN